MDTDLFKKFSFRCRRETARPGENLLKQVWTGNQMHNWHQDCESNPGRLVHSATEVQLRYLLPQFKFPCSSPTISMGGRSYWSPNNSQVLWRLYIYRSKPFLLTLLPRHRLTLHAETKGRSGGGGKALPYVGGYQVPVIRPPFFMPILHPMTPFFFSPHPLTPFFPLLYQILYTAMRHEVVP